MHHRSNVGIRTKSMLNKYSYECIHTLHLQLITSSELQTPEPTWQDQPCSPHRQGQKDLSTKISLGPTEKKADH